MTIGWRLRTRRPHPAAAAWPALLALMLSLSPAAATAEAGDCPPRAATDADTGPSTAAWTPVAERGQTCVYIRDAAGSSTREVMAVATIAVATDRLFEVISDVAHYPEFMPYVTASRVLKAEGRTRWVFQQLEFPFPISARYYTIRMEADRSLGGANGYRIAWTLARSGEPFEQGRGEPTRVNDGFWDLRPGEGGSTRVTYFIHTDPGGWLPAFAINQANTVAVPLVIERVRSRALGGSGATAAPP